MASEGMKNFRAVLLAVLGGCVLILIFSGAVGNGKGEGSTPDTSTSTPPRQTSVIERLCAEVQKLTTDGASSKYSKKCADAMRARDRDQLDVCKVKLKELDKMLSNAKLTSVSDSTIATACTPVRVDA